jgi:hypothetical protein
MMVFWKLAFLVCFDCCPTTFDTPLYTITPIQSSKILRDELLSHDSSTSASSLEFALVGGINSGGIKANHN